MKTITTTLTTLAGLVFVFMTLYLSFLFCILVFSAFLGKN